MESESPESLARKLQANRLSPKNPQKLGGICPKYHAKWEATSLRTGSSARARVAQRGLPPFFFSFRRTGPTWRSQDTWGRCRRLPHPLRKLTDRHEVVQPREADHSHLQYHTALGARPEAELRHVKHIESGQDRVQRKPACLVTHHLPMLRSDAEDLTRVCAAV